eukprot:s3879_g10.t1
MSGGASACDVCSLAALLRYGPWRRSRAAFFIFNPSLVPKEPKPTEEAIQDAKIIYYSPSCAPIEEKRSQVGMVEGLISFTAQFSGPEGPLRHIRTKQLAFSVLEVEPQIWMVLVMRHAMVNAETRPAGEQKLDEDGLPESTLQEQVIERSCKGLSLNCVQSGTDSRSCFLQVFTCFESMADFSHCSRIFHELMADAQQEQAPSPAWPSPHNAQSYSLGGASASTRDTLLASEDAVDPDDDLAGCIEQAVAAYLQNPGDAIPEELLQEGLAEEEATTWTSAFDEDVSLQLEHLQLQQEILQHQMRQNQLQAMQALTQTWRWQEKPGSLLQAVLSAFIVAPEPEFRSFRFGTRPVECCAQLRLFLALRAGLSSLPPSFFDFAFARWQSSRGWLCGPLFVLKELFVNLLGGSSRPSFGSADLGREPYHLEVFSAGNELVAQLLRCGKHQEIKFGSALAPAPEQGGSPARGRVLPEDLVYQKEVRTRDTEGVEIVVTAEDAFAGIRKLMAALEGINGKSALLTLRRSPGERPADFLSRPSFRNKASDA